jgi:hypothetical protein
VSTSLNDRCVPISAPYDAIFSVSFREYRRSELIFQGRKSALNGPWINVKVLIDTSAILHIGQSCGGIIMFQSIKVLLVLSISLVIGCATSPSPSGKVFDSPIGEWTDQYETTGGGEIPSGVDGKIKTTKIIIIDETRAIYPGLNGRVEFYAIDEQGRWKGYWIDETLSKYFLCSEEKGGSPYWGEIIYQFNETYNQYTGTWDKCGEGKKYSTKGFR